MSSTVGVQRWFRSPADLAATAGELSRHAREFGFTFVGDDDDFVKQECTVPPPALPPVPPLIPLGAAGRLKAAREAASDIDCDDSGRSSAEPPAGTYGGVIMVNSGDAAGDGASGGCVSEDDEEKLLRLFGGGDSDSVSAEEEEEEEEGECGAGAEVRGRSEGECAVVLDPLPSAVLRSLSSEGRVSVERAAPVEDPTVPGPDAAEARAALQPEDSAGAPREERHELESRRSPRALRQDAQSAAAPTAPPPPLLIDPLEAADAAAALVETSRDNAPKKPRHRKSESPRKAVRRRRERRSSSSGASKKHRKRSTSTCSTTSSTCSNSSARPHRHRHHHKHHKHRRRSPPPVSEEPPPTPRVNPIFVWIKQDNTRIVEVLCEDYDKRNRIRLTKTAHGWRAMPRTERLACGAVADPLRPLAPRPPSPTAPWIAAAPASSTTDCHGEALPASRCIQRPTDGSARDQNNSPLVADALPDCPSGKDRHDIECETKDEVMEEVDEEVEDDIERVSPVKEIIELEEESERYECDNEVNDVSEVQDSEHIDSDIVVNEHVNNEHVSLDPDEHVNLESDEHVNLESDEHVSLEPDEHVNLESDEHVNLESDEHVNLESDDHVNIESDEHVDLGSDDHLILEPDDHVDDEHLESEHINSELIDSDHVDSENVECFDDTDGGHDEHETEILVNDLDKDDIKSPIPEVLGDDDISSFHEHLDDSELIEEEQEEVHRDMVDNTVAKEEADLLEDSEVADHEAIEPESLVIENEDDSPLVDSACVDESEEPAIETDACDTVMEEDEDVEEEEEDTLTPTDLSLPKTLGSDHDIPVNCKNIPRNISTVIPPVVPSPQPRSCPPTYPPVTPAHQSKPLHTSKFLESLLSSPRKCHEIPRRASPDSDKGPAPLDLGVTPANRGAGSPTVSCSDESRKITRPAKEPAEGEPKAKCLKVEDITLKNLLSRQPDAVQHAAELDLSLASKKDDTVESGRKSRLLELLTSEPSPASVSPSPSLDALSQLKKVLSDPDITVPDPLLVPRNRLQELISNPGREIPRLLTCRPELRLPEALAYPTLVQDPDLLVVSLSHLQSLLQKTEKEKTIKECDPISYSNLGSILDWQLYQQQAAAKEFAKELDSQIKAQQQQQRHQEQQQRHHHQLQQQQQQQSQQELDAATAAALNQMLWLPYLTQLEAAATACGNPQDFLNILNTVFPPTYPQAEQAIPPPPPHIYGSVSPSVFNLHPNDFKSQMEVQSALMLWQSAMSQAANGNALNNNNNSTSNNNHRPVKTPANNIPKNIPSANGRYPSQNSRKYNSTSSARTSPITPNNFHSPPPPPSPQLRAANNHASAAAATAAYLATAGNVGNSVSSASSGYPLSPLHQQYNVQRNRHSSSGSSSVSKSSKVDSILETKVNGGRSVSCKSLFNLLSGPHALQEAAVAAAQQSHQQSLLNSTGSLSRQQQQHSHLLAALEKPSVNSTPAQNMTSVPQPSHLPPSPLDLSGATKKVSAPKLKVKEHLIDPAHTPKLLKADPSPEVTTSHTPLWHPLFGSQKTSLNSPWSWTTVTVNGE